MLYQIDVWKRIAYSPNPSGFYDWSSVWYIDSSNTTSYANAAVQAYQIDRLTTRQSVLYTKYIVKSPPGRGNVVFTLTDGFNHGLFTNGTGGYSLIEVARWRFKSSAGRWTYKYGRLPLYASDIAGGEIVGFPWLIVGGFINSVVSANKWRDSHGDLLVSGLVTPTVRPWQLRHGTKRRERQAPP